MISITKLSTGKTIISHDTEENGTKISEIYFTKITDSKQYEQCAVDDTIDVPYKRLVEVLGEPFKNGDPDFPEDPNRVDVCWGLISEDGDGDKYLYIWNIKNGPRYLKKGTLDDIKSFEVSYMDNYVFGKLLELLKKE
jgi:hypothetical protein